MQIGQALWIQAGFSFSSNDYDSIRGIIQLSHECQTMAARRLVFSCTASEWHSVSHRPVWFMALLSFFFFTPNKHKRLPLSALELLDDRREGGSEATVGKLRLRAALKRVIEFGEKQQQHKNSFGILKIWMGKWRQSKKRESEKPHRTHRCGWGKRC